MVTECAQRVRALFDAHSHKTIATVRADGSPSGIEVVLGRWRTCVGSVANAREDADLCRDPRFAVHSSTVGPVEGSETRWLGEAKLSGDCFRSGHAGRGQ